ncbi:MAG: hypothetical protein CL543_02465 [Alcanivorax sp.]|nr:hypothetical protein [Alcanivorax sp.]
MFTLVTGAPGSSKTSHTLAKYMNEKSRPVYYRGIRDLKLEWNELTDDQAREWHEHVPDGAIVILDEAQQLFPVRPSSKAVPPGLTALETHRHHGWDVIFISQEPTLLDSHARKICNEHLHYSRPFGAPYAIEYHSGSGFVSPGNKSELDRCNKTRRKLPKQVFGLYHSAEIHTHKFRPPKLVYILVVVMAVAAFSWWKFFRDFEVAGAGATADAAVAEQSSGGIARITGAEQFPAGNWSELVRPQIAGLPYTAPVYDAIARKPVAAPVVAGCMAFENDQSDCRCYTQQGTRIRDMAVQVCRRALEDGVFNHLAATDPEPSRAPDEPTRYNPDDNG